MSADAEQRRDPMSNPKPALLTGALEEALHGEFVPKFLATLDENGRPNVVLVASIDAAGPRSLYFGVFLLHKTKKNLQVDQKVAVAVITEDLSIWTLKGRFRGFEQKGPLLDQVNNKPMFRYNSYMRISDVGLIDVESVTASWKLSKLEAARDVLPVKARSAVPTAWDDATRAVLPQAARAALGRGKGTARLPPRVADKFARTQALKVLAWKGEDGYPVVVPALSLFPTPSTTMLFGTRVIADQLSGVPAGTRMAANVVTLDPISYQVKGTYEGTTGPLSGKLGRLTVDEVYSASPPLPGEPIPLLQEGA